MWTAAVAAALLGLLLGGWYAASGLPAAQTLCITCATTAYHLWMRLLVGGVFDRRMHDRADLRRRWYQPQPWEAPLYAKLGVRRWKSRLPTYDPASFDQKTRTWTQIAQAKCQAELVHEVCAVLSLLPIAASIWLGAGAVFVITSLAAAGYDLRFAIVQRYDRSRILQLLARRGAL